LLLRSNLLMVVSALPASLPILVPSRRLGCRSPPFKPTRRREHVEIQLMRMRSTRQRRRGCPGWTRCLPRTPCSSPHTTAVLLLAYSTRVPWRVFIVCVLSQLSRTVFYSLPLVSGTLNEIIKRRPPAVEPFRTLTVPRPSLRFPCKRRRPCSIVSRT
jgi:hypothetical protein